MPHRDEHAANNENLLHTCVIRDEIIGGEPTRSTKSRSLGFASSNSQRASEGRQTVVDDGRPAVPVRRVLLLRRRDARGLAPRGAVTITKERRRRRRRRDVPRAPRRFCWPRRGTRCDRAATSDERQVGSCPSRSSIRRRPPEADATSSSTSLAGLPADQRRRDGTPVARTASQVAWRAAAAPGAHQLAIAFHPPTRAVSLLPVSTRRAHSSE